MDYKNVTQICTALVTMTDEELRTINEEVVALMRHRQTVKSFEIAKTFTIGQKVQFTNSRNGQVVFGVIEKINVKTIKVKTDGGRWSVSPGLIRAA